MQIEVDGRAAVAQAPERATLTMRLGFEGGDPDAPLRATTELVRRVQSEVQQLAGAQPSPTTWSAFLPISTRSWRPYAQDGSLAPMRYAAAADVKVKFRDFAALARFCSAWGAQEGVTLSHVEWTLVEQTHRQLSDEVLTKAVQSAQRRAESIARAARVDGVQFESVSDPRPHDAGGQPAFAARAMSANAGGEGFDLSPEDVRIEEHVRAVFSTSRPGE